MERVIKSLIFLSIEQIIEFNHDLITEFGGIFWGDDNLKNPGSLEWVLDRIQYPLFGIDTYPSIAQKAALLGWFINEGHVFHDGNKRTSTFAVLVFLAINFYSLNATFDELIEISERIANCKISFYSLEEYISWIEDRIVQENFLPL